VFPNTVWDLVRDAGAREPDALERFARAYRAPVVRFLRGRGASAQECEDLCHEVFVRLLRGGVLAKADPERGRFRALLCTVTKNVLIDWRRRRPQPPVAMAEPAAPEPDFDRAWALHHVERAMERLRVENPTYFEDMRRHLDEAEVDRNRLWIARGKLTAYVRHEVALTCRSSAEIEEELSALAPYLGRKKNSPGPKKD
jgi:RNA polymerase sigma factor (sigma-70 family)